MSVSNTTEIKNVGAMLTILVTLTKLPQLLNEVIKLEEEA